MEALAELDPARAASTRNLCAALAAAHDEEQQDIWGSVAVSAEAAVRRVGEKVRKRVGARLLLVFEQARGLIDDVASGDAATRLMGGWWRESSLARSRRACAHAAKPLPPARPLPTRAHVKRLQRLRLLRAREVMQRVTTTLRRKKGEAMQRLTTTLRE